MRFEPFVRYLPILLIQIRLIYQNRNLKVKCKCTRIILDNLCNPYNYTKYYVLVTYSPTLHLFQLACAFRICYKLAFDYEPTYYIGQLFFVLSCL
jgi:hypothetical protein